MKIKQNFLFCFGYFLLLFAEILQTIPIVKQKQDIITLLGIILLCLHDAFFIIKKKKSINIKKIVSLCLIFIMSLISYSVTRDFTILKLMILMISTIYMEFDEIVKWDFKVKSLLVSILILMYFLGVTQTKIFYRLDGTVRYTLGFIHPNTLGFYTMMLVFEFFYIHRNKLSIKQYTFAIIIFLINWKVADSRTCAIIIMFFIIYNLLRKKFIDNVINNKIIKALITYSFVIFTLASISVGLLYNPNSHFMNKFNELLSLRPQNYKLFISSYPVNILGNTLPDSINGKFLDNAYLLLLLKFGIIQYIEYLILTIKTFKNLYSKKSNYLIVILLLLLLYGMMENMIIRVTMNIFILAFILPLQEKIEKSMGEKVEEDKLISIIVPIYNSENNLKKCLNSILCQTYRKIEIILINDGSTDASAEICKEYLAKDSRIKFISTENHGVSHARNKGVEIAKGDYIAFVDSDDTIEKNFISVMYNSCIKNTAEICVVNVNYCYGKKIKRPIHMENNVIEANEYYKILLDNIKGFVCNKLYHKSIFQDIKFDEDIAIGEDLLFNVRIASKIDKVVIVNEYLYNYFQNKDATYNSKYNEKKISEIYAYDRILELIEKKCSEVLVNYKCEYVIMAINQKNQYKNSDYRDEEVYTIIKKSMDKYYNDVMKSDKINVMKKLYIILFNKCYKFVKLLKFIKNRVI